ncbi:hypothetical protein [Wolbachia endosymbiont (group A) of Lasioglossum fulvicorne]
MKFLRDKLKELIKKIFARDLSFNQRLDKEIKELQEKLGSGELSEAEFARALERLTALQDLKLRLQMAVVGWIVTMFAEMFGVELAAAVEASTEKEDKKAEKTSLKEEVIKEVRKDVEIKVDEREKPKVPVSLFEVSPGFVRPVVLSKPDLEIASYPLKHLLRLAELERRYHENSQKPEKVNEEKKTKPEEPKKTEPALEQKAPKKEPVIFRDTGRSSEKGQWENDASRQEIPTVGSVGEQNMRNSGNIGKETIDIDKICGELLAGQDQISPESELNSINVQPKGGYKRK